MNIINLHITNNCNYNCTYCFGKFAAQEKLTFEQSCKVVDNIKNYFVKNNIIDGRINLAGGEPLLCPYLDELIDYIDKSGIKVSIITNGSLLTKEKIKLWKDKVFCIGLSIDSIAYETNCKIGRCCNNKCLNINHLVRLTQLIHKCNIKLKINVVISKLNIKEDFTEVFKRLKPDKIKFLQMEIVDGVNQNAEIYKVSNKEFNSFCKKYNNSAIKVVKELSGDMENSYLMINLQGEFQTNNSGRYQTYGNCLQQSFDEIIKTAPIDLKKFFSRYNEKCKEQSTKLKKKICVFGGHETWIKAISPLVKDVKFISDNVKCSKDLIRNTDEIWIQVNCISHSFLNKVQNLAKSYNIPVNYFDSASAKKCAEQILSY